MTKTKILTLISEEIFIRTSFPTNLEKRNCNAKFYVDLDNKYIYNQVVDRVDMRDNCPLFDQLLMIKGQNPEDENCDRSVLIDTILMVDFNRTYKKKSGTDSEKMKSIIENGFYMKYGNRLIHMIAFEKSGNMSRHCRLSFIDEECLDAVNLRLNVGIDFSFTENNVENNGINLSKYYAYRGLYLSTSKRINHDKLKINPDTFIVIDDAKGIWKEYRGEKIRVITSNEDGTEDIELTKNVDVNSFTYDGQGLICPEYAGYINEFLDKNEAATSFQIRMPFVKGMLHTVDFHEFVRKNHEVEYLRDEPYYIEDIYGIKRDLKKAGIILSSSMFKCKDWLYKSCQMRGKKDPIEEYCTEFNDYRHGLYISGTDLPYGNTRITNLSYQMLNTLDLDSKQLEELVHRHLEYVRNPIKLYIEGKGQASEYNEDGNISVAEDYANWQKALLKNRDFANSQYIRQQLKNKSNSLLLQLLNGKIIVNGQTRYLVRDLMMMLRCLINDEQIRKKLHHLKVFPYRFYMAQGKKTLELKYDEYCGFFRSPHLSRNEQCILLPFVKNGWSSFVSDDCDVLDKYLGKLTGTVIMGNESVTPMALGGADFDGDLVTLITDKTVMDGIIERDNTNMSTRKRYRLAPTEKSPYGYDEIYPHVEIPSNKEVKSSVPKTIPYDLVHNTFSSRVGIISNASITIGQFLYNPQYKDFVESEGWPSCAKCTILAGLELDAVKHGKKPVLPDFNDIMQFKSPYLEFMDQFEKIKNSRKYHFDSLEYKEEQGDEQGEVVHILRIRNTDEEIRYAIPKKIQIKNPDGSVRDFVFPKDTNIDQLPVYFMKSLGIYNQTGKERTKGKSTYFNICTQKNLSGISDLKAKLLQELDRYHYYLDFYEYCSRQRNYSSENITKMIFENYDRENAQFYLRNRLGLVYCAISNSVDAIDGLTYADICEKIVQEWQYLTDITAKKAFISHTFHIGREVLDGDEWDAIFSTANDNYKLLYFIVNDLKKVYEFNYDSQKKLYRAYIQNKSKTKDVPKDWDDEDASSYVDCIISYIDTKQRGTPTMLYDICLDRIKKVMNAYRNLYSAGDAIFTFFQIVNGSTHVNDARFFWECFKWEELEQYIDDNRGKDE